MWVWVWACVWACGVRGGTCCATARPIDLTPCCASPVLLSAPLDSSVFPPVLFSAACDFSSCPQVPHGSLPSCLPEPVSGSFPLLSRPAPLSSVSPKPSFCFSHVTAVPAFHFAASPSVQTSFTAPFICQAPFTIVFLEFG